MIRMKYLSLWILLVLLSSALTAILNKLYIEDQIPDWFMIIVSFIIGAYVSLSYELSKNKKS